MKKLFLIPLLAFSLCATAWAAEGDQNIKVGGDDVNYPATYAGLQLAFTHIAEGGTITLETSVDVGSNQLTISKSFTLSGASHTLTSSKDPVFYANENEKDVTLSNVTISTNNNYLCKLSDNEYFLNLKIAGNVSITGYSISGSAGTVKVMQADENPGILNATLQNIKYGSSNAVLYTGTYDVLKAVKVNDYCAEGYYARYTTSSSDSRKTYTIEPIPTNKVALYNGEYYTSFENLTSVLTSGAEVTIYSNLQEGATDMLAISYPITVTLADGVTTFKPTLSGVETFSSTGTQRKYCYTAAKNLYDFLVGEAGSYEVGAEVDMTNISAIPVASGAKTLTLNANLTNCNADNFFTLANEANLTVLGAGSISSANTNVFYVQDGTLTLGDNTNGPVISIAKCPILVDDANANVTINKATINSTGTYNDAYAAIWQKAGTIIMNGGTVQAANVSYKNAVLLYNGTFTLNGGEISSSYYGIHVQKDAGADPKLYVNGGSVSGTSRGIFNDKGTTVEISNGTISSNTSNGSGIYNNQGTVTMSGGTINNSSCPINNVSGSVYISGESQITGTSYGISNSNGTVNISENANIQGTASGSYGIWSNKTLTITGGTISGTSYGIYNYGTAAQTTISGGNVSSSSCGIYDNSGHVNINGGTITGTNYGVYTYAGFITMTSGGVSGNTGVYVQYYSAGWPGNLDISGGIVNGTTKAVTTQTGAVVSITGGTFSHDVSAYCATGYLSEPNLAGTSYTVFQPDLKFTSNGYSTFACNVNVQLTGATAYRGEISDNVLTLYEITDNKIPAGEGVVIKDNDDTYSFAKLSTEPAAITNDLIGCVEATTPEAGMNFVLSEHENEAAFYEFRGTQIPAHKAYLNIPAAAQAPKRIRMVTDTATDVENVQQSEISSQKVLRDGQVIIIRNGVEYNVAGQVIR